MSSIQTIERNSEIVGILTAEHRSRGFRFHSGVAPYDTLDGAVFAKLADARKALDRVERAVHPIGESQDA